MSGRSDKLTQETGRSGELDGQVDMGETSWTPRRVLNLEEWLLQGKRLGAIGKGAAWWIGDWVNYGNAKFGEKYGRAARITRYDVQSLMNMAYVASRFEISRRREKLSWSHHSELAPYPVDDQDRWLRFTEEKCLSVHSLRSELRVQGSRKSVRRNALPTGSQSATNASQSVTKLPEHDPIEHDSSSAAQHEGIVCPNCGCAISLPDE